MDQAVKIISFGYDQPDAFGDLTAPAADMTFDLRRHFRDPHVSPGMRELTGKDCSVFFAVMATPGVYVLTSGIIAAVLGYLAGRAVLPVTVAVGCAGGRHRSVAVADFVARDLRLRGTDARAEHRDLDKPVLAR